MTIKFGTDGWRAIIADDFTFANVEMCVQAIASHVIETGRAGQGVLVGYDTRFGSRDFARRAAEVLAGNDIPATLAAGPCPTPTVSYAVTHRGAGGAVVITASHNPPEWNGIKFKPHYGGSASAEVVSNLERHVAQTSPEGVKRISWGRALERGLGAVADLTPSYMEQLGRLVDLDAIRGAGLSIVVDAMHGAGAGYLPALLEGHLGALTEIRGAVNPAFPGMNQPEPIAENLSQLSGLVTATGADVGIAYDGDADRLGVVDEGGRYLNTLQVFALLAFYLLDTKGLRGPIVKSLTSSDMLFRLGEIYDVPVLETGVGFKYAGPLMMKENALMAGEESGGYGFRGHIPERDGILSSLLFLEFMARTGKRPSELLADLYDRVGEWHYGRRDVPFTPELRPGLEAALERAAGAPEVGGERVVAMDATDGRRFRFERGWLIVRFSGTEPLLRVYAESDDAGRTERLLAAASELLELG